LNKSSKILRILLFHKEVGRKLKFPTNSSNEGASAMLSHIGIKIANGEFYSILQEGSSVKKRLVLTTVHDNQRSVQIDLYKSQACAMIDAIYIGSIVVEKISPKPKGEPSIELVISANADGEIVADAVNMDMSTKGEHQSMTVSLRSIDESSLETEIPDYELEPNDTLPSAFLQTTPKMERRSFPWLLVVGILLVLVAIGLAVWFFVIPGNSLVSTRRSVRSAPVVQETPVTPPAPIAQAATPPTQATQPAQPAPPPAVTQQQPAVQQPTPAQAPRPPAQSAQRAATPAASGQRRAPPVASFKVPAVIPREGVAYRIRWGDTLWDIADHFYGNPRLYPRIARFNNIRNPHLIIPGRVIRVPPRN